MTVENRKDQIGDNYFDSRPRHEGPFDATLLREPVAALPARRPITVTPDSTVTNAMRLMQSEHRGCVLVTDDGTDQSKLTGIFTERDILFRIVDRGRNPAALPVREVMTPDPEAISVRSAVAYALNMMSVGGFRHIPVIDDEYRPVFVVSVRDVVEFLVQAFPREVLNLPVGANALAHGSREGA